MRRILIAAAATFALTGIAAAQQAPVSFNPTAAQTSQPAPTSQRHVTKSSATTYGSTYDNGIDYSRTSSIPSDQHSFPARPGFQER